MFLFPDSVERILEVGAQLRQKQKYSLVLLVCCRYRADVSRKFCFLLVLDSVERVPIARYRALCCYIFSAFTHFYMLCFSRPPLFFVLWLRRAFYALFILALQCSIFPLHFTAASFFLVVVTHFIV